MSQADCLLRLSTNLLNLCILNDRLRVLIVIKGSHKLQAILIHLDTIVDLTRRTLLTRHKLTDLLNHPMMLAMGMNLNATEQRIALIVSCSAYPYPPAPPAPTIHIHNDRSSRRSDSNTRRRRARSPENAQESSADSESMASERQSQSGSGSRPGTPVSGTMMDGGLEIARPTSRSSTRSNSQSTITQSSMIAVKAKKRSATPASPRVRAFRAEIIRSTTDSDSLATLVPSTESDTQKAEASRKQVDAPSPSPTA